MPPSGYSPDQSRSILGFLRSCASALESEAEELGQSVADGLRRECGDIERALPSFAHDPFAAHILRLTRDFYARVLDLSPSSSDEYWSGVDRVLVDVERAVLEIHVPPRSLASRKEATA